MKTKYILFISLLSAIFFACEAPTSYSTPGFRFSGVVNSITGDSLSAYDEGLNVLRMDTIKVGDVISFNLILDGGTYNNLTSFSLTLSDTTSTMLLLPETSLLDNVFSSSLSDYKNNKFVFKSVMPNLYFPFQYIALKANASPTLKFEVTNDAKYPKNSTGSNTASLLIKTPIVNR